MPKGVYPRESPEERFFGRVELDKSGCLVWKGSLTHDGYGRFWFKGKTTVAHLWAYQYLVGPVPEGMTLDHLCRNRSCVEIGHLEPVSMRENIARGVGPSAQNMRKNNCPQGHEYDWFWLSPKRRSIQRMCRECKRVQNTLTKEKQRHVFA